MPYRLGKDASNAGKMAKNHAIDFRRASCTCECCDAGRIETTFSMASSSAYMSRISYRKARALRGPMTRRNAVMATRKVTDSGVIAGRSETDGFVSDMSISPSANVGDRRANPQHTEGTADETSIILANAALGATSGMAKFGASPIRVQTPGGIVFEGVA